MFEDLINLQNLNDGVANPVTLRGENCAAVTVICQRYRINYNLNINTGALLNAIELDAIAHDGKVIASIPELYREEWNDKVVRVIILASDESPAKPKKSLLSSLKQIRI